MAARTTHEAVPTPPCPTWFENLIYFPRCLSRVDLPAMVLESLPWSTSCRIWSVQVSLSIRRKLYSGLASLFHWDGIQSRTSGCSQRAFRQASSNCFAPSLPASLFQTLPHDHECTQCTRQNSTPLTPTSISQKLCDVSFHVHPQNKGKPKEWVGRARIMVSQAVSLETRRSSHTWPRYSKKMVCDSFPAMT